MKKKLETVLFNCQITRKIPIAPDIRAKEPTENVHLYPSHNALSYDLIPRWAFPSFSFFLILFYLVLILWVKNTPRNRRKQILNLTLGGRTGTITVSPLSTVFVLCGRNGFLQLYHRGGEVTISTALPCELTALSQNVSPPCPHGKERTKSGAWSSPTSSSDGDPCPAVRAIPAAHGKCHFPKQEPITFATSKLNKWFPDSWSNLSFMLQFRNYEQDSSALS